MTKVRAVGCALVIVILLILQVSFVSRLPLPLGRPDLLVLAIGSLALLQGPVVGMVAGFGAGLLCDLASDHVLGRVAIVLTVLGYLLGLLHDQTERSWVTPLVTLPAAAVASALLYAGLATLFDRAPGDGWTVIGHAVGGGLYAGLLTPLVFSLAARLVPASDIRRW